MNFGKHNFKERWRRSLVKAITYRGVILTLDFTIIYLFTGKYEIALGFMLISNFYTSIAYYLHERIWDRISWGRRSHWSGVIRCGQHLARR
jgi:adenylylsulfate kinase